MLGVDYGVVAEDEFSPLRIAGEDRCGIYGKQTRCIASWYVQRIAEIPSSLLFLLIN